MNLHSSTIFSLSFLLTHASYNVLMVHLPHILVFFSWKDKGFLKHIVFVEYSYGEVGERRHGKVEFIRVRPHE